MVFNVPQFIDMEDKIVGPLTAKQLGWFGLAGVFMLIFWGTLDKSSFLTASIVVLLIAGALAFYRPYNQSLIQFIISSVMFVFRPKDYSWKRSYDTMSMKSQIETKKIETKIETKKSLNSSKLDELSKILDKNRPQV